jgi:hypothetical protein
MPTPKKVDAPAIETPAAAPTPATQVTDVPVPAYDPANLAHVLKRLSALAREVRDVSADLAVHYQKHSRVHHIHGGAPGSAPEAPAAHDPATMARIHTLQSAIGEFIHVIGAHA